MSSDRHLAVDLAGLYDGEHLRVRQEIYWLQSLGLTEMAICVQQETSHCFQSHRLGLTEAPEVHPPGPVHYVNVG